MPESNIAEFVGLTPSGLLEKCLAEIRVCTARITTIHHHISELRSIHNSALPLHIELPPELLLEIFRHLPFAHRRDIRLMHVCRLWRAMLQKTPEFWASFLFNSVDKSSRRGPRWESTGSMVTTALVRSSPLGVRIAGDERHIDILHTVPNHVVRLSSLTIAFWASNLEALFTLLHTKIPGLELLKLKLLCEANKGLMRSEILNRIGSWTAPADHFPRLRTLEVNGVFFSTLATPSLKHLRLFGCSHSVCVAPMSCSRTNVPSLGALISGLQRCPLLSTCQLFACLPSSMETSPGNVLHMPELTRLVVNANAENTRTVLETMTFPPTTFLNTNRCFSVQDFPLPTSPLPVIQSLQTLSLKVWNASNATETRICRDGTYEGFSDGRLRLQMGPGRVRWTTTAAGAGRSEVVRTLVLIFSPLERLTVLELNFGFRIAITREDWKFILESFVRIKSLTVRIDSCRSLLRALRTGQTARALETLSISCLRGGSVHEPLVRAVESGCSKHLHLQRLEFRQTLYNRLQLADTSNVPMSASQLARLKAVVAEVVTYPDVGVADLP